MPPPPTSSAVPPPQPVGLCRPLEWLALALLMVSLMPSQVRADTPAPIPTPVRAEAPAAITPVRADAPAASPTPAPAAPTTAPASTSGADGATAATDPTAPVLGLDEAIAIAMKGNRNVLNAGDEITKTKKNTNVQKSNLYPHFETEVRSGELLTPVSVTFDKGSFGTYPIIGPIPGNNINITATQRLTTYFVAALMQPITQLPRIQLSVKAKQIDTAIAVEELRAQRESVTTDVKKSYASILQTESALVAALDNVRFYRELDRTVGDRYKLKAVLYADVLDVKKHLAEAEVDAQSQRDNLANNKAQFNVLLGRDIHTPFEVKAIAEPKVNTQTLVELEELALKQRPQVRQSILKTAQAVLDQRIAASEFSPDLSVGIRYIQPYNVPLAPNHIVSVGAELTWQPLGWGKYSNQIAAKNEAIKQAQNNQKQVADQVLVEVGSQYRNLKLSVQRVAAADLALQSARENLRVALARYQQKTVLLQDLYETQTRVASARRNYLEAVLGVEIAQAELQQAIGEDE